MTDDDHLERINALTRNARQTWFALLAALVFVGITLMGVEHIDFYGVGRATTLPLVNVEVPTRLFFIAAPILIAAIYGYFHLYLIRLFDALGAAPNRLNGIRLGDAISPWLVSDAALDYRARKRQDHSTTPRALEHPAALLNLLLAWGFGLIILAFLWWQSLPARNFFISQIAIASLLISTFIGIGSLLTMRLRLRRGEYQNKVRVFGRVAGYALFISTLGIASFGNYQMTESFRNPFKPLVELVGENALRIDRSIERTTKYLAPLVLSGENLVERPKGWLPYGVAREEFLSNWCKRNDTPCSFKEMSPKQRTDFNVEWWTRRESAIYELRQPNWSPRDGGSAIIDFRGAALYRSFLPGANLKFALLQGAEFTWAVMENANLDKANLRGAILLDAHLENANLRAANMQDALLSGAQLQHANLSLSEISGTKVEKNALKRTDLSGSVNFGGMLRNVDLTEAIFDDATDFRNVFVDASVTMTDEFRKQMSMQDPNHPCQWVMNRVLKDKEFYGRWRGWLHEFYTTPLQRAFNVPVFLIAYDPIPPDDNCEWKTGSMPGAEAE